MARFVNEKPQLPLTPFQTVDAISRNQNDLVKQLQALLYEYGFRINSVYPKDATENAQMIRVADGVSAPTAVSGAAFIYVDEADGDLKIKFGDGFTATIQVDS